jgi:hypothetical protein
MGRPTITDKKKTLLFGTRKQLDKPDVNNMYYNLSIHIDKENQIHIDHMKLFIKLLNDKNIKYQTGFTSSSTTIHNDNRFNVCVEIRYKEDLEQIHKNVYGF